jgi:hypothetical protein
MSDRTIPLSVSHHEIQEFEVSCVQFALSTLHKYWDIADKDFNKSLQESHKITFGTFRSAFDFNPRSVNCEKEREK